MASEKEANLAREQHSDWLRDLGAHAVAVDEVRRAGEKTFAVVAYFEEQPAQPVPKTLEARSGKKFVEAPLVVKVAAKFKPE